MGKFERNVHFCVLFFFPPWRTQPSSKKEEKKSDKPSDKDGKDSSKKQESKSTTSSSGPDASKKDDKKHGGSMYAPSQVPFYVFCCRLVKMNLCPVLCRDKEPWQDGGDWSCQRRPEQSETTVQEGEIWQAGFHHQQQHDAAETQIFHASRRGWSQFFFLSDKVWSWNFLSQCSPLHACFS